MKDKNMNFQSVYDLKSFYTGKHGRLVRRLVAGHMRALWPDVRGQSMLGLGYAAPYLRSFQDEAERALAVMPVQAGVHGWPSGGDKKNRTVLACDAALPFETESVDLIVMVHSLEMATEPDALLAEVFRVLKSSGRLMVVVPNRLGFWARADWTPFGHGRPYTAGQLCQQLKSHKFVPETIDRALYMPPFQSLIMLRAAYSIEGFGAFIFPALAGLHLVDAVKEIYAPTGVLKEERARQPRRFVSDAVPTGS